MPLHSPSSILLPALKSMLLPALFSMLFLCSAGDPPHILQSGRLGQLDHLIRPAPICHTHINISCMFSHFGTFLASPSSTPIPIQLIPYKTYRIGLRRGRLPKKGQEVKYQWYVLHLTCWANYHVVIQEHETHRPRVSEKGEEG